MSKGARKRLLDYGVAILAVAGAVLVRWLIDPWVGNFFPLATLYLAIAVAVWVGGYQPALLAVVLGFLICKYLFIEPRRAITVAGSWEVRRLIAYFLWCAIIIGFGEALRALRRRLEREKVKVRQSMAAHQAALQQLQIVTESMAAPVTRCSRDFTYLWVSKPYADWMGRSPEEIIGRPIADIIGPEAFAQLRPQFEKALGGQVVRYEEQVPYQGIGLRWVNAVYTPTRNAAGVPDGWVAVVLDLTERRQMEEALRQSEQRFARFMEQLPGLAWIKDLQGRYVYANDAAFKVFGCTREELYGKTDDQVFPPETAAQFQHHDRQALASERGVQIIETLEHKDGLVHHSLVSKFPILGPEGSPAFVGGMAIDITDRVQAEAEMQAISDRLREADRRKDEFLATLAHELRNPLAPIRNAIELLRHADGNTALREKAQGMMERQVKQMIRLVDDLLDISRITRGKLRLRLESVTLAVVVRSAIETAQPAIDAQGHQLTLSLPPEPILLSADPIRLAQVFSNLLNNAAKYTEKGGHIVLTAERQGGEVRVAVRDTGIGIAPERLAHVFEMFSQEIPALERSHGGLGIGLSLVRGLVELHGGSVAAHSAGPGKGSEFVVRLPAARAP